MTHGRNYLPSIIWVLGFISIFIWYDSWPLLLAVHGCTPPTLVGPPRCPYQSLLPYALTPPPVGRTPSTSRPHAWRDSMRASIGCAASCWRGCTAARCHRHSPQSCAGCCSRWGGSGARQGKGGHGLAGDRWRRCCVAKVKQTAHVLTMLMPPTHSLSLSHSLSHYLTHTLSISLTVTFSLTHSLTHSLSLALTRTLLSLSHPLTLTILDGP